VLGEVKVAKLVSQKQGFGLTDRDLVAMITSNPGDVLSRCWSKQVGRLLPGSFGDVTILRARGNGDVWSQVVKATEKEVTLVVVGGKARYGDSDLMTAAAVGPTATMTVSGRQRKIALPDPTDNRKAFEWSDIVSRLNAVRKDPKAALERAAVRARSFAGPISSPDFPLELRLDMPSGATAIAGPPPDPAKVVIPLLPTLVHDKAFFDDIHGRGFHGGLLDGLADFYRV
jgi:hypothetical protein